MSKAEKVEVIKSEVREAFDVECKEQGDSLRFNLDEITPLGLISLAEINRNGQVFIRRSGTGLVVIIVTQ